MVISMVLLIVLLVIMLMVVIVLVVFINIVPFMNKSRDSKSVEEQQDDKLMQWIKNNPEVKNRDDSAQITLFDLESVYLYLSEYVEFDDKIQIPICGINFRGLTVENIGIFEGYLKSNEKNNIDPFAIGVYTSDGIQLGFVEKDQSFLHSIISGKGGSIPVTIEVSTFLSSDNLTERFKGYATIDKNELL